MNKPKIQDDRVVWLYEELEEDFLTGKNQEFSNDIWEDDE